MWLLSKNGSRSVGWPHKTLTSKPIFVRTCHSWELISLAVRGKSVSCILSPTDRAARATFCCLYSYNTLVHRKAKLKDKKACG